MGENSGVIFGQTKKLLHGSTLNGESRIVRWGGGGEENDETLNRRLRRWTPSFYN